MPIWNKQLWRTALRIENAYRLLRGRRTMDGLPTQVWSLVSDTYHRWQAASHRDWLKATNRCRDEFTGELDSLIAQLRTLRNTIHQQQPRFPQVTDLYAELLATSDDFGDVAVDDFEIFVVTDPITLGGVYLGSFEIRLDLARLAEHEPYRIVALEPHPAANCSETTHPHVHCQRACLGEGKAAIAAALAEGRLSDVFMLINRVLHTYGQGAAYTELDRWFGASCTDCGDVASEDECYACQGCDSELCGSCLRNCSQCGVGYCSDCATFCAACEEVTCSNCLRTCSRCEADMCAHCLSEGVCDGCRALEEEEQDQNDEAVTEEASP